MNRTIVLGLWAGWLMVAAALGAGLCPLPGMAGETLDHIKSRALVRCGVSEGIAGFSTKDATGQWSGLDVDFCRAVAAAALGSADRVAFVSLAAPGTGDPVNVR